MSTALFYSDLVSSGISLGRACLQQRPKGSKAQAAALAARDSCLICDKSLKWSCSLGQNGRRSLSRTKYR